jgi:hypothetical protein
MPSKKRHQFPPYLVYLKESGDNKCPICGTVNARFASGSISPDEVLQGWCDACTNFVITRNAVNDARAKKKTHLLAAFFRQLPDKPWKETVGEVVVDVDNWEAFVSSITELGVSEQFDEALVTICRECPGVGLPSRFQYLTDWPVVKAESAEAVLFMIRELCDQGYLSKARDGVMPQFPPAPTWKAYQRIEQLQSAGRSSNRAFVAMSFSPTQDELWLKVIQPGILDAGYNPIRVDKEEHAERIDDYIIAQIRRCRFVVADFTEQKAGVYFEAGFGYGLGRKVIWMCNRSDKDKLHFDTRQFNHIIYDDLAKARQQLTDRIVALEGEGTQVQGTAS